MKIKIIVAFVASAVIIIAISCGLFSSGDPKTSQFNIQGKWVIDSIANKGSDSSKNVGMLALAIASKNGSPGIQFNSDSTFEYIHSNDSAKGSYYLSPDASSLFLNEDSVIHQFNFLQKTDSAISFSSVDSVFYYLRRK